MFLLLKSRCLPAFLILVFTVVRANAQANYDPLLVGTHLVSLQWISLQYFGQVEITKQRNGSYRLVGGQKSRENGDSLYLKGVLVAQSPTELVFTGRIMTRVASWSPEACVRLGTFSFRQAEGRKYWRLQPVESPCNIGADYIDIYTRVEKLRR